MGYDAEASICRPASKPSFRTRKISIVCGLLASCYFIYHATIPQSFSPGFRYDSLTSKELDRQAKVAKYSLKPPNGSVGKPDPAWQVHETWELLRDPAKLEEQKTCLTYQERYAPYTKPLDKSISLPPTPGTKTALLYRVNKDNLQESMSHEFRLALRALIAEVQDGAGIDVYLHVEVPTSRRERQRWAGRVPKEFRERIITFSQEEVVAPYPEDTFDNLLDDRAFPHLSAVQFFNLNTTKQYDFLWWLEEDVRTTGSWSTLFEFIKASIPQMIPQPYAWELRPQLDSSNKTEWQPDLIVSTLYAGEIPHRMYWGGREDKCLPFIEPHELAKAFVHLTGFSRNFAGLVESYFKKGHNCYSEIFILSLAKKHHIPLLVLKSPSWINIDRSPFPSFHSVDACPYQRDWMQDGSVCRPGPALLHKPL